MELTLRRALAACGRSLDEIWFPGAPMHPMAELAAKHGVADGGGLHFDDESVRYLWLDRMQRTRVSA